MCFNFWSSSEKRKKKGKGNKKKKREGKGMGDSTYISNKCKQHSVLNDSYQYQLFSLDGSILV
jgi:hypothetical protein